VKIIRVDKNLQLRALMAAVMRAGRHQDETSERREAFSEKKARGSLGRKLAGMNFSARRRRGASRNVARDSS
jgi:hypothetical protein